MLFISRVFVPSSTEATDAVFDVPAEALGGKKKKKQKRANAGTTLGNAASASQEGLFAYHPEDEVIARVRLPSRRAWSASDRNLQFATGIADFDFTHAPARDEDAFGVDTKGRLMLVPYDKLGELVAALDKEGA